MNDPDAAAAGNTAARLILPEAASLFSGDDAGHCRTPFLMMLID
jgi:hypothetical protein